MIEYTMADGTTIYRPCDAPKIGDAVANSKLEILVDVEKEVKQTLKPVWKLVRKVKWTGKLNTKRKSRTFGSWKR